MQKLLDKTGQLIENDPWIFLPKDFGGPVTGAHQVLPLQFWQASEPGAISRDALGIWFDSDEEPEVVAEYLASWPCIGIHFPTFMDGRGFSLARLIREQHNYQGDLRAFGHIIPDQLFFLTRCGFSTFLLNDSSQSFEPEMYFDNFSVNYQTSADQAEPLFRRRA